MAKKSQETGKQLPEEIHDTPPHTLEPPTLQETAAEPEIDTRNAVGVDIGTSKIVFAVNDRGKMRFLSQRNAFIQVDYSKFTEGILKQNQINYYNVGDSLLVYGDGAETFAKMLNMETRRPMKKGLLNPKEAKALDIIKGILDDLTPPVPLAAPQLCFSIPGVPKNAETDIIYHEAILNRHLEEKGYNSKSINEGLAVVFSELEKENFSGFGVSMGGGMCNVCLSFLSVPLISFSINKGGDYIDDAVSSVTSEVNTRVRHIKENELDLSRPPANDIEDALHIYYDDLIKTLVKAMKESIDQTSKIPNMDRPVPIVLSGGTVKPRGFKERFETYLNRANFPIKISEVRISKDPLTATARGSLMAAMYES